MITVDLRTARGGKVATIEIPDLPTPPTIVKWGASYYVAHTARVYVEGWCYAVPAGGTVQT